MKNTKTLLILGPNGFLGKHFSEYFGPYYNVFKLSHEEFRGYRSDRYIRGMNPDVILYCLNDSIGDMEALANNLSDWSKLVNTVEDTDIRVIQFGSGCEIMNPVLEKEDASGKEDDLWKPLKVPSSGKYFYQLGKREISKDAYCRKNILTLRLFGCFGHYERKDRLPSRLMRNELHSLDKNKQMDWISVYDLCTIVDYFIHNSWSPWQPADYNVFYPDFNGHTLGEFEKIICNLDSSIKGATNYTNKFEKYRSHPLSRFVTIVYPKIQRDLLGLETSLEIMWKNLRKKY